MFGFDPVYIAIFVFTIAVSGITSMLVKSRFKAGEEVPLASGMAGHQVAALMLRDAGVTDVQIVEHQGFLSDHYNPTTKTLALSPSVYHGRNASAAGVAAHEAGHALQHAENYFPMWIRSTLVPAAQFGDMLGPFIIMGGLALQIFMNSPFGHTLALIGVALIAAATAFSVVTVPVEFDASSRAKQQLAHARITQPGKEQDAVSSVLTAAGLTYVAAAVAAVLNLLYYAWRAGLIGGGNRDD